jgi:WD40 repeat protein
VQKGDGYVYKLTRTGLIVDKIYVYAHGVPSCMGNKENNTIYIKTVRGVRKFSFAGKKIQPHKHYKDSKKYALKGYLNINFSKDDKYLIASSAETGDTVLWNDNYQILWTRKYDRATRVRNMAFSPNNKYILLISQNLIEKVSIKGKLLSKVDIAGQRGLCIKISEDGNYIFSKTLKELTVYDKNLKKISSENAFAGELLVISPDNKNIFVDHGGNINYFTFSNKQLHFKKKKHLHYSRIRSMDISEDGKLLITGSKDGQIKCWNWKSDQVMTILYNKQDWICYLDNGYFSALKNSGYLVGITKGVESFGGDQFAVIYNRPDIVLKNMGLGTKEQINHFYSQYKKRLKKMGIKEDQLTKELHVPEAEILETKQDGKFLEILFRISDSKYNLKRCNIYVNDVPLYKGYGKIISGRSKKLRTKIELSSGKNKIEVTCFNEKGAESYRALTYADYNKEVKGDLYYIGFGVSKYKNSSLDLKYAHQDAEDLARLLSGMKGKYKNIHTKTYLNEEVTVENIKKAKELLKNAKVDDTFVLFIAGHGMHERTEEAAYYYLTHNADINDLSKTAADFDLIENLMQGIKPRNKLFLIDTCESGEIDDSTQEQYFTMADTRGIRARTTRALTLSLKNKRGKTGRTYLFDRDRYIYNDLMRRSGAIVFSSSLGGEFSYENDKFKNGLFTEAIIKSLTEKKADKDKNSIISTDELRDYVMKTVSQLSDNLQNPTVDRDNIYQKFGFPIIK